MTDSTREPLTGMHGIAYRAGKDIFAIFEVTDPVKAETLMQPLLNVLVRMLAEQMHHIGNKTGWKQQYHAEQKAKQKSERR